MEVQLAGAEAHGNFHGVGWWDQKEARTVPTLCTALGGEAQGSQSLGPTLPRVSPRGLSLVLWVNFRRKAPVLPAGGGEKAPLEELMHQCTLLPHEAPEPTLPGF